MDIEPMNLKPGDVVEIKSRVKIVDANYRSHYSGKKHIKATVFGETFYWAHSSIDSVTIVNRAHPTPHGGDIWKPPGLVPAYYSGGVFRFPAGLAASYLGDNVSAADFFDKWPNAKLLLNIND
jgi:hypothetical protein